MESSPAHFLTGLVRAFAIAGLLMIGRAAAADVVVTVLDRDGAPVSDVVVYLESSDMQAGNGLNRNEAVMDQRDKRFVPHILVVQTGTSIDFPNSDVVAHHVYSFSHPNHFKLPIYKGEAHPPVTFAESGIVILGCNIHDNMLGYIFIVDTPVFAKTDETGTAILRIDKFESAQVFAWSPRIRDNAAGLSAAIEHSANQDRVTFRLSKSLRRRHDEHVEALSWSEY